MNEECRGPDSHLSPVTQLIPQPAGWVEPAKRGALGGLPICQSILRGKLRIDESALH